MKLHHNYIALADIMANGVVVLLILITLSLSVKEETVDQELEQISDIGTVMAREIASSLITNALPSSAPAVLHDYRHARRANMPRIALHPDHLFIEGAGDGRMLNLRLSKGEMLQKNNRLDKFLAKLTPQQKSAMRMDIHHIRHYYLALSILKKHKARIADWHFLGLAGAGKAGKAGSQLMDGDSDQLAPDPSEMIDQELPPPQDPGGGMLTQDVDLFPGTGSGDLSKRFGGKGSNPDSDKEGGGQGMEDIDSETMDAMDAMAAEMARYMAQSSGNENEHYLEGLSINFSDGSQISDMDFAEAGEEGEEGIGTASQQLLGFLLSYLADRQRMYQEGEFVDISAKNFKSAKVESLYKNYQEDINFLYENISDIVSELIPLTTQTGTVNSVSFPTNYNLVQAQLNLRPNSEVNIFAENKLSLNLYPQPAIDDGLQLDINASDIILFANQHNDNNTGQFDWQLLAILDASLSDIKIGFAYAKRDGKDLIFASQENDLRISGQVIQDYYLASTSSGYWKWILLLAIFIIFLYLLYRGNYQNKKPKYYPQHANSVIDNGE